MELLKKRHVAFIITAVVIILSTIFSVHRTLGAECQRVRDSFFTGVVYDGYARKSVATHLKVRIDAANAAATITANYSQLESETQNLRAARNRLIDTLNDAERGKTSVEEVYNANEELQSAFEDLEKGMEGIELSQREAKNYEKCRSNFYGAQAAIEKSGYNEAVREFYRTTLNVYPTNFLWRISWVDPPELYE
ncbi:MAG TPA: hypothetical protein GXZ52_06360 [Clostridiales bacterium]|nr:hypothetical protein [Clostridiales bacterium]